jgi:hypothetical protein
VGSVEQVLRDGQITPTIDACSAYRLGQAHAVAEFAIRPAEEELAQAQATIEELEEEISGLRRRLGEIGLLASRRRVA